MRLNAPKKITWWIAVILGVVGVIANFVTIPSCNAQSVSGWSLLPLFYWLWPPI